jgi:2-(1,2-epoxy-1,2-dihydrophenyl)acetyl-CoA isomerase
MNNNDKPVLLHIENGVARVTLNRPQVANAVDRSLAHELMQAMHLCADDPTVRAVLLTGSGGRFCAGGDLGGISAAGDHAPEYVRDLLLHFHEVISTIDRLRAPVVAVVQGTTAGAGIALACSCDIVIAGESSRFLPAYPGVGLSPDGSTTWFLPRILGLARAMDLMLTNRELDAATAERWGMVSRVVPDDDVMDTALKVAADLANGPAGALGAAKRLLRDSSGATLHTQMIRECEYLARAVVSDNGREGMAAFLNKRPPRFND